MLVESINTGFSLKNSEVNSNIGERAHYEANTGVATVSVANSNLDGTGTLTNVLSTGATTGSVGSLVKKITIKALANATRGMVRLFIYDGSTTRLIEEFNINAVVQNSIQPSFEVSYDVDWSFGAGLTLKASTQYAETYSIAIEALDIIFP
ncbi:MAG: hypothetical protein LCH32_02070 [Bacteroidetes bacterium]|nr:hypothetical protein [Bacteroidota bacterium]